MASQGRVGCQALQGLAEEKATNMQLYSAERDLAHILDTAGLRAVAVPQSLQASLSQLFVQMDVLSGELV
jgi:hypothetical protein